MLIKLHTVTHEVLQAFSNRNNLSGMFCDLAKAFHSVNRSTLVTKLSYGINSVSYVLQTEDRELQ